MIFQQQILGRPSKCSETHPNVVSKYLIKYMEVQKFIIGNFNDIKKNRRKSQESLQSLQIEKPQRNLVLIEELNRKCNYNTFFQSSMSKQIEFENQFLKLMLKNQHSSEMMFESCNSTFLDKIKETMERGKISSVKFLAIITFYLYNMIMTGTDKLIVQAAMQIQGETCLIEIIDAIEMVRRFTSTFVQLVKQKDKEASIQLQSSKSKKIKKNKIEIHKCIDYQEIEKNFTKLLVELIYETQKDISNYIDMQ